MSGGEVAASWGAVSWPCGQAEDSPLASSVAHRSHSDVPPHDWTRDFSPDTRPTVIHAAQIEQRGLQGFLQDVREQGAAFSTLSLAENKIGDAGAQVLCDVLSGSEFLHRLNLHDTGLGSAGFDRVGDLLKACSQIETLVVSGNRPASELFPNTFCTEVGAAPSLRALQLSSCELTEAAVCPLFESLSKRCTVGLPPLERLALSHNRLAGPVAGDLCGLLAASGAVGTLDLSHNALGPKGAEAFSQRVLQSVSPGLRRLILGANGLEARGCRALTRLWNHPASSCLEHLDLRVNGLTEAASKELCGALGKELGEVLHFGQGRRVMLSWHDRPAAMMRRTHGGHEPLNVFWHD